MPKTTPDDDLAEHLRNIEQLIGHLRGLKGFGSVKWGELETQMRRAADELHRLGDAAKVWKS